MSRPRNDDRDLAIMAAWLYYVHGLGQEQVARALDLSRTKVTRLLSQARDTGLVKISVDHDLAETLALADWIAQRYGVERCIMTPPAEFEATEPALREQIGRHGVGIAAASFLTRRILDRGAIVVGVGGGRTLGKVMDAISSMSKSDLMAVSLIGTSWVDDGSSAYSVALRLAQTVGGQARTLPAPFLVGHATTRAALEADPVINAILALGARTDLNLLGCGSCEPGSTFGRVTAVSDADLEDAVRAGAVGEIAGYFLTAEGKAAPTALNERRVGVGLDALRAAENVIVASGARKVAPLKAVIRAGLARTIVIDQAIAIELAKR
jgi:DNA-binding transcriptional regulator LsrR (DeoR family)